MNNYRLVKRHRLPNDEFFAEGDRICPRIDRIHAFDGEVYEKNMDEYVCQEDNCRAVSVNKFMFEAHYAQFHQNVCRLCKRNFPTNRLLTLHIQENHDSFFRLRVGKQNFLYECLVEGCSIRCEDDVARRVHLINEHSYPTDFKFAQI
ncbi:zinc finger protein 511-like [Centruroides sculpturatus]|uniref:zinc finger protein 511-like n=1 Tax=Centruroides sculpturatus TaxID=218467 RepID=UPI000C6E3F4A|nr:zinc finger protein 511-like [Centruroides sculpturatus]